jgi:hypothetical protein
MRSSAFLVATRFLKYGLIFGLLLPTDLLAQSMIESGPARCTHSWGLDETIELQKPMAAGRNAVENARKIYVDRFGIPTFEHQLSDGVVLTWVNTNGKSIPVAQNVHIQIIQGALQVTCGISF